ncbi:hypothetical protein A0H81_12604 [Grifola frondosa]|uniref:Uncharacterized protein n=1 Tax=Grifola frondosa TaxID=5627 RepID=A0A1C7LXA3_GRIFR|nr:hypothetical protein A0H81_12604 [Grifola frondosa]
MSATHDPSQSQRAVDVDSRSQLLVRTSQFLKKVSNFRASRLKNESTSPPAMCERTARSMDLGSKAFVSHNVFDESPHGRSLDHDRESGSAVPRLVQPYASDSNLLASRSETSGAVGAIDGLPSQPAPPYSLMPEPSTSTSARRALAPRLATLPPPMMARFNAQGSARLTPSIVTRQPPMPLLNLPMLPPPTQSQVQPIGRIGDTEQEADPETASLGDSDDDSDGGGTPETEAQEGSDEEDEEENSEPSPEVQEEAGRASA